MAKVDPIPPGHTTVTPSLTFHDGAGAIEFYKKAFGATELGRFDGPDGKIVHAEIRIGNAILMLNDEVMGQKSPRSVGGSPVSFYLYFDDVDAAHKKAVAAGAKEMLPPTEMFWGDRMSHISDPYGYEWNLATHTREMSMEEIAEAGKDFMKRMAAAK